MNAKLSTMIQQATDGWNRTLTNGRARVMVTLDTSSIARGADETLEKLRAAVAAKGIDADVGITGSWGMSWMEPCVAVRSAAGTRTILYANVTPDRVDEFVQAVLVDGADFAELAVGVVEGTATFDIPRLADHPWMQGQTRRL
ncbi:MAG TPA: hypothetical protein VFK32_02705, partial [Tepidiformaceae bacterium]|nr:hypothetical protein [Tepidiformaceae bacterium]